ncbi:hypothetical protein ACFX15_039762 [Malus domestica]
MVRAAWDSFSIYGCPMFILQAKLKLLKPILKSWNLNVFGNVNAKVDAARASLEAKQLEISTRGFSEDRYAVEIQAHSCLSQALIVQEKFWSDKARIRWLRDVDRNTKCIHNLAKTRRAKNFISSLRIGPSLEDDVHVVEHFSIAFIDDGSTMDTSLVSRLIPSLVTDSENASLLAIPTF